MHNQLCCRQSCGLLICCVEQTVPRHRLQCPHPQKESDCQRLKDCALQRERQLRERTLAVFKSALVSCFLNGHQQVGTHQLRPSGYVGTCKRIKTVCRPQDGADSP